MSNCGFETGDLQGWTQGGNLTATGVGNSGPGAPHTGSWYFYAGPATEGTLTQTLSTAPGSVYDVAVWLAALVGTYASEYTILEVDPDGAGPAGWAPPLVSVQGPATQTYTQYTGTFTAGGSQATLRFRYQNSPAYWYIDDVTVVARALPGGAPGAGSPQQPDGWIRKPHTSFIGDNIYNTTAAGQTVRANAHRTDVRKFEVRLYNDDARTATFTVTGTNSARGVRVQYFSGGVNVTTPVRSAGGLSFVVAPGADKSIRVQVKVRRQAAIGARKFAMVTATWTGQNTVRQDAVKAVVRVR